MSLDDGKAYFERKIVVSDRTTTTSPLLAEEQIEVTMVHQGLVENIMSSFSPGNSTAELEFQRLATRTNLTFSMFFTVLLVAAGACCFRRFA